MDGKTVLDFINYACELMKEHEELKQIKITGKKTNILIDKYGKKQEDENN